MQKTFLVLLALAFITPATAGLLPGRDAYAVVRNATPLPNGMVLPASVSIIERPKPGTFVPGVVIVKTRAAHGVARNSGSIIGSAANNTLASADVRDVQSAYFNLADGELAKSIGLDRIYQVRFDAGIEPFDLCARLMENSDVEYAIPLYIHTMFLTPNDPRYSQQPWMSSTKTNLAWDVTKGSASTIIAIIDSGTDWQHEDLASRIWTNPNEIPDNGIDDDKNGFIDDIRGWDFVGNVSSADVQQGILRPDNNPRVTGQITDVTGHGTVVGGCAGAATDNAIGVASTGFNCKIIPIKCGSDNPNFGGILQGYNAIAYAADLGAPIINCSWGGAGIDPGAQDIVNYATNKGSLVIAASGNDGLNNDSYLQSPASLNNVLSVGSCSVTDRPSNFSNYGMNVDVYAPGENILSTYPNNQYRALTGTSFSSPLTSGIAALIKTLHPDWTPEMIAAQMRGTVDEMVGVSANIRPLYWGRVNAQRCVTVNSSWTSGTRMPGIVSTGVTIGTSGKITSLEKTTVQFNLKNVLADAQNVAVTVQVNDPRVRYFGNSTIQVGSMARNATTSGSFELQLDQAYPWYASNINVTLTISAAGNYVAFEPILVPVQITTQNSFSLLASVPSSSWDIIDYTTDGTLYATGTVFGQRALLRGTQGGGGGLGGLPYSATALDAVSSTQVLFGGIQSGRASISRSTSGGNSWSTNDVSAQMASVESIRMYDGQNGIAIGNPVSGRFGVASTTNGGGEWRSVTTAPSANGSERVVSKTVWHLGNAFWFATSSGRILSSLNRGQTWAQGSLGVTGAVIVSMAFRDSSNGIILYRTGLDEAGPYRIASSTNGGVSWRAGTTDLALGTIPVSVGANQSHHVLVGVNGEVFGSDDNGSGWQVILSQPAGVVIGTMYLVTDRPTIFLAGAALSMLQYRYAGPNGTKIPEFSTTQLGFGFLEPGQTRLRTATLRNTGTSDLVVSEYGTVSVGSTPAGAFSIATDPRTIVPAGGSTSISLRCTASDTGAYEGRLIVLSNGTPSTIELPLFAMVTPATSVAEDQMCVAEVTLWPTPASTSIRVTSQATISATVFSLSGQQMYTGLLDAGQSTIDVTTWPSGTYTMLLVHGMGVRSVPLIVRH